MNAIEKKEGACVILAGAGTGKTHTIVEKIKNLINSGTYKPERIVCITFSNEASNNLSSRVRKALNNSEKEPVIETFHSFSALLLRKYGEEIGIPSTFNIIEPNEAKVVLHRHFKIPSMACHRYVNSIGIAKDLGIELDQVQKYLDGFKLSNDDVEKKLETLSFELNTLHLKKDKEKRSDLIDHIKKLRQYIDLKKFVSAWSAYEKIKLKKNYQDYSDLNKNALELLRKNTTISKDYDYIIVDEFQDTNKMQLDFLIALAAHGNITIVGDLNQSIYRFRGAYKENFSLFKKHFNVKNEDVFTLNKSYRSSNKILRAAHKLILNNYENKEECFLVENHEGREGGEIEVYELKNGKEEARKVVELVKKEIDAGIAPSEICIMFRTHQQGRVIRNVFEESGIGYSSVTKGSLLKNKSIKTVRDYITILDKLVNNKKGGEQEWWDLIYQLDFNEKDLIVIGKTIKDNRESENLSKVLLECLESIALSDHGKLLMKILTGKIKKLTQSYSKEVPKLLQEVYKIAGLTRDGLNKEDKEINLNLNKFMDLARTQSALYSDDLQSFLHYLDILDDLEIEIKSSEVEIAGVRLMTLHATKGLEYKTVILTNMAQKRFPIENVTKSHMIPTELYPELQSAMTLSKTEKESFIETYEKHHQLLEERRLAYVAFTRAKNKLIMTYAKEYSNKKFLPSQFLNEVEYNKNNDFIFSIDDKELLNSEEKIVKSLPKFSFVIQSGNFDEALLTLINNSKEEKVQMPVRNITFSPSALILFNECQKQYEYKYVYNMPERKTLSWDAILMGSFVHLVLEKGVKSQLKDVKDFIDVAKELHKQPDWESVNIDEASNLIKIFYVRNKDKYNEKSKTEQQLKAKIGNFNFIGFADRIDFKDDGIEIIDYKTGGSAVSPINRNWQLGYYALAAKNLGMGKVKKVCLDMLKLENPVEFEIDDKGDAKSVYGRLEFNIHDVENELIKTAQAITDAHQKGFTACSIDKNCQFCNEYVYGF